MSASIKGRVEDKRGGTTETPDDAPVTQGMTAPLVEKDDDGKLQVNFNISGASGADKAEPMAADPVAIATICQRRGHPSLTAGFISEGATMETVEKRLESADMIRLIFADANKAMPSIDASMAESLIEMNASQEQAREIVSKLLVSQQAPSLATEQASAPLEDDAGWGRITASVTPKYVRDAWEQSR